MVTPSQTGCPCKRVFTLLTHYPYLCCHGHLVLPLEVELVSPGALLEQ